MKFKVNQIIENAKNSFLRFPFAITLAVFASIVSILLVDCDDESTKNILGNLLIVSLVWFTPLISSQLLTESLQIKQLKRYIITGFPLVFMIIHYWFMPEFEFYKYYVQAVVLGISFHLSVSFIAFLKHKSELNFWQFNQTLFIQILISAFFSLVLYAGLALSLLSVEKLFNVYVNSDWYAYLLIFIAGCFSTWYFLSQIPQNTELEDNKIQLSKFLNILTKYILLPIASVYLIILYLYIGKIIIQQEWPQGWVANLVLSYSAFGMFTFLLSYPTIHRLKSFWAKFLPKVFFLSLFPLIIVLFLSIYIRINEYGLTENRYYVILLALWLAGISIYLIIKKFNHIKYIPLSLCVAGLLTAFGPWSSFSVSEASQQERLENLLNKYDALKDGKVEAIKDTVAFKDRQNISSIVQYLYEFHDTESLNAYFNEDLKLLDTNEYARGNYTQIVALIGFDYVSRWETNPTNSDHFSLRKSYNKNSVLPIHKADYCLKYNSYSYREENNIQEFTVGDSLLKLEHLEENLKISYGNSEKIVNLQHYIQQFFPLQMSNQDIDDDDFKLSVNLENIHLLFYFSNISGDKSDNEMKIQSIDSDIFVSIKNIE